MGRCDDHFLVNRFLAFGSHLHAFQESTRWTLAVLHVLEGAIELSRGIEGRIPFDPRDLSNQGLDLGRLLVPALHDGIQSLLAQGLSFDGRCWSWRIDRSFLGLF